MNLSALANKLSVLRTLANTAQKETTNGISYSGDFNQEVKQILEDLKQVIIQYNLTGLYLQIDDLNEDWSTSFQGSISNWSLSIGDKKELLESAGVMSVDVDAFLFFSKDYFVKEWLTKASNIKKLNSIKPKKIFIDGLELIFGGPRIAFIPLNKQTEELPSEWLKSTKLPDKEKIHKTVHFITSEEDDFSPENFLITWGDMDNKIARTFHIFSAKALLRTLVQEYYNDQKAILYGKKRLEVKISELNEDVNFISKKDIDILYKIVTWCYAKEDETTRILLLIDRLTLDINQEKSLLHIVPEIIEKAYAEAESRYKYVILDRKVEYTKELAELQKDISNIADKYAVSTNDYISGLLKDILAFAFVLTVGVVAKKFIDEKLLFSPEAELLFKAFAIYLFISFFLRILHFIIVVYQFEKLSISWKEIVRNHMSASELKSYVNKALKSVKITFICVVCLVSIIYIGMAIASWNSTYILKSIIHPINENNKPNQGFKKREDNSTNKIKMKESIKSLK
ncbi:MAG: hypothetical protein PHX13_00970 [Thiovulaceae bacterium]|nr:hypothetical protein [Sulfurimonadaceae bacterium]